MPSYAATTEDQGRRADAVLTDALGVPRTRVSRLMKSGGILMDGAPVKPHAPVVGAAVFSYPEELVSPPATPQSPPPELNVLYEDDDILVIDKPAGLLVHEAPGAQGQPTVTDALRVRYPGIETVGEDPSRPGIVHRLDKDVSGVLAIAKTAAAYAHLKRQFQERTTEKIYLALAYGELPKDNDAIALRIARSKAKGRMVARAEEQEGKEALTEYDVIERYRTATYARVRIHTGRTHQIRVHFKAIDHPLVGDKLYKKKSMTHLRPIELNRIFLHAHELEIELMDGTRRKFVSPLPEELEDILKSLPKN